LSTAFGGVRFAVTKASKAKTGTKTAAKKPAAKKPAAKKPAKKTAAKKPAAKKKTATAKKGTAKKKAVKKKPVKKKKKAVKKPVKKPKKKVVLTPEQKKRKEIKELREKALDVPKIPPASGWTAFTTEKKSISPELSKEWAALPVEEKQKYIDKASAMRAAKIKAYEKWVASTSPAAIMEANKARARLKRLGKSKAASISDPRQPKRPVAARVLHMMDQYKSGRTFENPDGTKMSVIDILKTCNAEYLALPTQEKEKFEERHKANLEKYHKTRAKFYAEDGKAHA